MKASSALASSREFNAKQPDEDRPAAAGSRDACHRSPISKNAESQVDTVVDVGIAVILLKGLVNCYARRRRSAQPPSASETTEFGPRRAQKLRLILPPAEPFRLSVQYVAVSEADICLGAAIQGREGRRCAYTWRSSV